MQDKAFHELLDELKIEHEFELVPGVAHNGALFYKTLGEKSLALYQRVVNAQQPTAGNWPNVTAPSHVFQRGDVEIVTFETEQDYDQLQELYRKSQDDAADARHHERAVLSLEAGRLGAALRRAPADRAIRATANIRW